jgi:hypothetical protein
MLPYSLAIRVNNTHICVHIHRIRLIAYNLLKNKCGIHIQSENYSYHSIPLRMQTFFFFGVSIENCYCKKFFFRWGITRSCFDRRWCGAVDLGAWCSPRAARTWQLVVAGATEGTVNWRRGGADSMSRAACDGARARGSTP